MLMELDILAEGREYISASRAAKKTGYAGDYIGQLCRSQKVPGRLVGRTWYVDLSALLEHKKTRQLGKPRLSRNNVRNILQKPAEVIPGRSFKTITLTYERDERPLLPQLLKDIPEVSLPVVSPLYTRISLGKRFAVVSLSLAIIFIGGFTSIEKVFPTLARNVELHFAGLAALPGASAISDAFSTLFSAFRNLKNLALEDAFPVSRSFTPRGVSLATGDQNKAAEDVVMVKMREETPSPAKAITQTTVPYSLEALRQDLRQELQSMLRAEISGANPVVIYQSSPTTILREEILIADTRPTVTRQSNSDVGYVSSAVSSLTQNGTFTGSQISGASILSSAGEFTTLGTNIFHFSVATGTSATTTNFFSTNASSTNFWANIGSIGTLTTGNFLINSSTTLQNFTAQSGTLSNLLVNGSSTLQNFTAQNATTTNATSSTFAITGNGAGLTFYGTGNHDITASAGTLRLGANTIIGNIVALDNTVDIGDAGTRFDKIYANEVNASTLVGTISGGNVNAETLTINFDNATADGEDSIIAFERGSTVPNALITWDSANDRFKTNADLFIGSGIGNGSLMVNSSTTLQNVSAQYASTTQIQSSSNAYFATSGGKVGVGTTTPAVLFDIYGTNAIRLPVGTTAQRPGGDIGFIRFNTTSHQFEGYGDTGVWQGLGGVIDADQDTYITADTDNSDEDTLRLFTAGVQRMTIASGGSVGISTTSPSYKLSVSGSGFFDGGTIYASALVATSSITTPTFSSTNLLATGSTTLQNFTFQNATGTAATTTDLYVSNLASTTALRVANSAIIGGNVGIGTTNPSVKLDVNGTTIFRGDIGFDNFSTQERKVNIFGSGESTGNQFTRFYNTNGNYVWTMVAPANGSHLYWYNFLDTRFQLPDNRASAFEFGEGSSNGITITNPYMRLITTDGAEAVSFLKNVGIGTTSPSHLLTLASSTAQQLTFSAATASTNHFSMRNAGGMFYLATSSQTSFATSSIPSFMIDGTTGNVGMGTTAPTASLQVTSSGSITGLTSSSPIPGILATATGDTGGMISGRDINHSITFRKGIDGATDVMDFYEYGAIRFFTNGNIQSQTEKMRITSSGYVGIGTSTPSLKLDVTGSDGTPYTVAGLYSNNNSENTGPRMVFDTANQSGVRKSMARISGIMTNRGAGGEVGDFVIETMREGTVTEAMRVLGSGRVGIGTTSPSSLLNIHAGNFNLTGTTLNQPTTGIASYNTALMLSYQDATEGTGMLTGFTDNAGYQALMLRGISSSNPTDSVATIEYRASKNDGGTSVTTLASAETAHQFTNNGTELMTILGGGNVGIGTTGPGSKLQVNGNAVGTAVDTAQIQIKGSSDPNQQLRIGYDTTSDYGWIQAVKQGTDQKPLILNPDGGKVGIGTSSPIANLDIFRGVNDATAAFTASSTAGVHLAWTIGTDLSDSGKFKISSSTLLGLNDRFVIDGSGNVGIGTTGPGAKLEVDTNTGSSNTVAGLFRNSAGSNTYNTQIQVGREASTANALVIGHQYASADNTDVGFINMYGDSIGTGLSIRYGGNIGIGTTAPGANLHVVNDIMVSGTGGPTDTANSVSIYNNGSNIAVIKAQGSDATTVANLIFSLEESDGGGSIQPLYLKNNGNIGIGTTAPDGKLEIQKASVTGSNPAVSPFLVLQATDAVTDGDKVAMTFRMSANYMASIRAQAVGVDESSSLIFNTNNAGSEGDKMTIRPDGTVGIGVTAPAEAIEIGKVNAGSESIIKFDSTISNFESGVRMISRAGGVERGDFQVMSRNDGSFRIEDTNSSATRLTLTAGGFFGIGTTTPRWTLQLASSTAPQLTLSDTAEGVNHWSFRNRGGMFYLATSSPTNFATSSVPGLTIDGTTGNIGIGTASPGFKLEVNGAVGVANGAVATPSLTFTGDSDTGFYRISSDSGKILMASNGAGVYEFGPGAFKLGSALLVGWSSATNPNDNSADVAFARNAAGVMEINSGTAGTYRDLILRSLTATGSTTLQNFTASNATTTHATTTNLYFSNNLTGPGSFFVNSSGNVGIGTASPSEELHIVSSSPELGFFDSSAAIGAANPAWVVRSTNDGVNSSGGFLINSTTDYSSYTSHLSLNTSGFMGLGTVDPFNGWNDQPGPGLHIEGVDPTIGFFDTGAGAERWLISTDDVRFEIVNDTDDTARLVITDDGNVGIGQVDPQQKLTLSGSLGLQGIGNGAGTAYLCTTLSTGVVSTSTSACNPSSFKYKQNIEDISYGLAEVLALRPVEYDYKPELLVEGHQIGFIAEEMYQVIPEVVGLKDGEPDNIDYSKLTSLLVKAVQEVASITGSFKTNLVTWFADATNGIGDFFANRVRTEELCVSDNSGETCITKTELDALIAGAGSSISQGSSGSVSTSPLHEPEPAPEPVSDSTSSTSSEQASSPQTESESVVSPETTPEPAPETTPEPEPESTLAPEITSEPGPEPVTEAPTEPSNP